jgi:hypothetical protein
VKRFAGFAAATIAVSCGGAWAITMFVPGTDVARAVWTSAVIVVVVQTLAFSMVKMMGSANVIAGWGLGMILRFIALVTFALAGVKAMGLPMQPALLSMAGFFFVTTVIEPVFLKSK